MGKGTGMAVLMSSAPTAQRRLVNANSARRRRRVVVRAEEVKDGVEPEVMTGVRWDPAQLRWVRDERPGRVMEKTNKPISGIAYTIWPVCHTYLVDKKLQSFPPKEVEAMIEKNEAILLDVRLAKQFDGEHASGAINVPLFREVQGSGPFDILKKVALGGMAMSATERDPDFLENVKTAIPMDKKVIVMCTIGGTLDCYIRRPGREPYADPDRSFGRESRSLKAAYELLEAGYENVCHLDGGLQLWRRECTVEP